MLDRMPMLKDYADNIAKWLHPPARNQHQSWRWGTVSKIRRNKDLGRMQEYGQPSLPKSQHSKPGENVFESRNCFGLNVGWKSVQTLEIPTLSMNLDQEFKISKKDFKAPMNCFIVFVGGKFIKDVDSVVERAKEISEEFYINKPSMYFFEGRYSQPTIGTRTDMPMVMSRVSLKHLLPNSFLLGFYSSSRLNCRNCFPLALSRTE